jgi:hypothetical protein
VLRGNLAVGVLEKTEDVGVNNKPEDNAKRKHHENFQQPRPQLSEMLSEGHGI